MFCGYSFRPRMKVKMPTLLFDHTINYWKRIYRKEGYLFTFKINATQRGRKYLSIIATCNLNRIRVSQIQLC